MVRDRLAAVSEVLQRSNIRLALEFLGPLYMRMGGAGPRAGTPPAAGAPAANPGRPAGPPRTPFIWTWRRRRSSPRIAVQTSARCWTRGTGTIPAAPSTTSPAGKSRIIHVHVSDAKPAPAEEVSDNQRWMPGEGIIDLVGFFQALQKIGYDDGVSPEPLGRVPAEMSADDAAKLGLDTTTAVMKRAGVI